MARPISDHHRRICVGVLGRYVGKDHRCTRDLIGWLAAGSDSTRTGLMRIHVGSLVDDLGWSKPQIRAALARLQDDGLIVWSEEQRTVLCVFVLDAVTILNENYRKSLLAQCATFNESSAKSHAVKALQVAIITDADGATVAPTVAPTVSATNGATVRAKQGSGYGVQGTGFSDSLQSIPYGMPHADHSAQASRFPDDPDPSWFADPETLPPAPALAHQPQRKPEPPLLIRNPHLRAAKGLPPLDEPPPEPQAAPEPEPDDEIPEWAAAAAAKAAAPKALPALAPVQLTLDAPKAKKPLTEAQLDAIFAKQQMAKWVDKWNQKMATKHCAPAVPKALAPMAKSLIANLACIYSQDPLACPTDLIDWALEHSDYHAGRKGKRWTLAQWLSADHLGQMWTDYRDRCDGLGMRRVWLFRVDRTIADWRAAIDERQAVIARGNAINAAIEAGQPYLHLGGAHA